MLYILNRCNICKIRYFLLCGNRNWHDFKGLEYMVAGWQKRLWAPALLLTIVGGWWLAIELSQHCSALKDAPAGCFEFWFNRYQTLISSTAAIVAAWIAVRPVWRQLNLASAQTAVACQRRRDHASARRREDASMMTARRPRTGGLFVRHQAWVGLSGSVSGLIRRERRLL